MMTNLLAIGAIVNSALYLTGVFVAALIAGNHVAEYLAIAGAGATYVSYILDLGAIKYANFWRVVPLTLAVAAGIALLAS